MKFSHLHEFSHAFYEVEFIIDYLQLNIKRTSFLFEKYCRNRFIYLFYFEHFEIHIKAISFKLVQ